MTPTRNTLLFFLSAFALAGSIFQAWPQIDLAVAGWFYVPGQGFPLDQSAPLLLIRHALPYVIGIFVVGAIAQKLRRRITTRDMLFVLLAFALGPGLLVNTGLKDHWGRARPGQLAVFGGTSRFTPPLTVSDQCEHNCSFVAGDPSVGFALLAPALLWRRRRLGTVLAVASGVGLGVIRIMQGGHFLSDVVFCGLFVTALICVLYGPMISTERAPGGVNERS